MAILVTHTNGEQIEFVDATHYEQATPSDPIRIMQDDIEVATVSSDAIVRRIATPPPPDPGATLA